ncbi:MAG TPA: hypothetical protein VK530_05110 [Candidatus Acidoferrum sp.]|nr:hypothetical protein [Candidatus Acidoferrum sp.]
MRRFWLIICIICGVALLVAALLIPSHSRAIDSKAIEAAGARTPGLIEEGLTLVQMEKVGPAQMLLKAARVENLKDVDRLASATAEFNRANPALAPWGGADPSIENVGITTSAKAPLPVIELLMQRAVRERMLEFLRARASRRPGLNNFLANRSLTNFANFPAANSASGQAIDGAIIVTCLLYQGDHFNPALRDVIEFLALKVNKGDSPEPLEMFYLDVLSLGKRLDWISLTELVKKVEKLQTLRQLAEASRAHEEQFAALYAAIQVSSQPGDVGKYLTKFPETGLNDLSFAARSGVGGIELLLKQQHRVYYAGHLKTKIISYDPFGAWFFSLLPMTQTSPKGALLLKYGLLLLGSLLLARVVGVIGGTTQWHGLRFGADMVLALALTFILALFAEPFIGLPSQIRDLPIKFQIPTVALAPGSTLHTITRPFMNNNSAISLLPLLVFFVIQVSIYIWCLAKLNEIGRQTMSPQMKLKLLENEDHLFDAGLYIGFVGTIIAFMLLMMGVKNFSAMSAYSSTSFGIIFVSVLKIFHVRPLRRKLIIESETA